MSAVALQATLRYDPAAQLEQATGAVTPAKQKLPAGHASLDEALGQ